MHVVKQLLQQPQAWKQSSPLNLHQFLVSTVDFPEERFNLLIGIMAMTLCLSCRYRAPQVAPMVKNLPANAGDIRDRGSVPGRSPGGGHDNPFQYSCLENPMDREAWQAMVHGVTQSRTWLKRLCSSNSIVNTHFPLGLLKVCLSDEQLGPTNL